ncbi:MAG: flagellin [Solirubrobacterales bacterium]
MRIFHNIQSLNTYHALSRTSTSAGKALERLSSGLRINKAADDAAGLAISEKMRAQIAGLSQAGRNLQDGVSLLQTADGALSECHSILQRMRELAVQGANDTNTMNDRMEIQKEMDQLKQGLDEISRSTTFNQKNLLDGSSSLLWSSSSNDVRVVSTGSVGTKPGAVPASGEYRLDLQATPGTAQIQGTNAMLARVTGVTEFTDKPASGAYTGLKSLQAAGLAEGDYRLEARETPFGGISYIDPGGADTATPDVDLGITVSSTPSPDLVPYGDYTVQVADTVPFMAVYADTVAGPDVINGVSATGRANIDVQMDITAAAGPATSQTQAAWTDIGGAGGGSITINGAPAGGDVSYTTNPNYANNMYTSFEVTGTQARTTLAGTISARTYYRSANGDNATLGLTYMSGAAETVEARLYYTNPPGSVINIEIDDNGTTDDVDVDVSGLNMDDTALALEAAANGLHGGVLATDVTLSTVAGGDQLQLRINNTLGAGITLKLSGSAATTLGVDGALTGGFIPSGLTDGTAQDYDRSLIIDISSRNIQQIGTAIDAAFAGVPGYNVDAMAVDLTGGVYRLQVVNNTADRSVTFLTDGAAGSAETDLGLGGMTVTASGSSTGNRVLHGYTSNPIAFNAIVLNQITAALNTAMTNAIALADLAPPAGPVFQMQAAGAQQVINVRNDLNNTRYQITVGGGGSTITECGIAGACGRGAAVFGTAKDYNTVLGAVIPAGSTIEQARAAMAAWDPANFAVNWLTTPDDTSQAYGQFQFDNNDTAPTRREVRLTGAGCTTLFGGAQTIRAGAAPVNTLWLQARDRVTVQTTWTGVSNNGTLVSGTHSDDWWEGRLGTNNSLVLSGQPLPFTSITLPDSTNGAELAVGDSWTLYTSAAAAGAYDQVDSELLDGATNDTFTTRYRFNNGVLDNNSAVLLPQLVRTGIGTSATVQHNIDFGTIATQANAVTYSERYAAAGFNHEAYASYGSDTTYYFANGGNPATYLTGINAWSQEDDNCSLLCEVVSNGIPPTIRFQGKGYNRNGLPNDFGPVDLAVPGGALTVGPLQFDQFNLGGSLTVGDRFVVNVSARAGDAAYHNLPPNQHSDANIRVTGNPWASGGSTIEYRFAQDAENGLTLNLAGWFVNPLDGSVETGSILAILEGTGLAAGTVFGTNSAATLEVNYQGRTVPAGGASITSSYFQGRGSSDTIGAFIGQIEADPANPYNASIMLEVLTVLDNRVILRGQAHCYDKNGNYTYVYDDSISMGLNNPNCNLFSTSGFSGINFTNFDWADLSELQTGDRVCLSVSADAQASPAADELDLFQAMNLGEPTPYPVSWRFNEGVLDSRTTPLRFYQTNSQNGDIHDAEMALGFNDFLGGTALGVTNNLMTPRKVTDAAVFTTGETGTDARMAHHYTKLQDITNFYNGDGRYLLDTPRTLTLISNGKTAEVSLYATDEIIDILDRINQAVYEDLGQNTLVAGNDKNKFATFVDWVSDSTGLEQVEGSLVIRSAVAGTAGDLNIVGDEDIMRALGLTSLQKGTDNTLTVSVADANTGETLAEQVLPSGQSMETVFSNGIELQLGASLGMTQASYDSDTDSFTLKGGADREYIHLADRQIALQGGAGENQALRLALGEIGSRGLGVAGLLVTTRELAGRAISHLDAAISRVSGLRSDVGALQNRLEHAINNLSVAEENLTSSESRIRDVDMAKEMMEYTKVNILGQAGTAMLAQANQRPQMVLQLLGGK